MEVERVRVPIEIVEVVQEYQKLKEESERIFREMDMCIAMFSEWMGDTGVCITDLYLAERPLGNRQSEEGEYCDQHCLGDDRYSGTHYYQIEGCNRFVAFCYECQKKKEEKENYDLAR